MMQFYAGLDESDLRRRFAYFSAQRQRGDTPKHHDLVCEIVGTVLQNFLKMPPQQGKDQDFLCLVADGHYDAAEAMLKAAPTAKWRSFGRFKPSAETLARAFNKCGMSALHYTALDGQLELSAKLIAVGSQQDPINLMLETPLMLAAESGHADVVAGLLMAGASPEAQDIFGQTALMRASQKGHLTASYALLAQTPPSLVGVRDVFGYDALDYAIEARCQPLVQALMPYATRAQDVGFEKARTKTLPQLEYA